MFGGSSNLKVYKTTILKFVISEEGFEIDPKKVNNLLNWESPKSVNEV